MSDIERLQLFEGKTIRTAWVENEEKWYFSIVEMLAPDGKRRKTLAANQERMFRIIQSISSKKAEPDEWKARAN